MNPEKIQNHLRSEPFRPLRVFMSDGSSYDVRHPELALVTRREVIIALPQSDDELPEQAVYCDPMHITRIELIDGTMAQQQPN